MGSEIKEILKVTDGWIRTCSLARPLSGRLALCVDEGAMSMLPRNSLSRHHGRMAGRLFVVAEPGAAQWRWPGWVKLIEVADPAWEFWTYHNKTNEYRQRSPDSIGYMSRVHKSAVIGVSGMKLMRRGDKQFNVTHMGNVKIGSRCEIGPCTVIHRAVFDSTMIGDDVVIGSLCNIGHNVRIGNWTIITTGVQIGGSAVIGERCFIGMGAIIRNKVKIGDDVFVGQGSSVTKDLVKPGLYVGSPARRAGSWDGSW